MIVTPVSVYGAQVHPVFVVGKFRNHAALPATLLVMVMMMMPMMPMVLQHCFGAHEFAGALHPMMHHLVVLHRHFGADDFAGEFHAMMAHHRPVHSMMAHHTVMFHRHFGAHEFAGALHPMHRLVVLHHHFGAHVLAHEFRAMMAHHHPLHFMMALHPMHPHLLARAFHPMHHHRAMHAHALANELGAYHFARMPANLPMMPPGYFFRHARGTRMFGHRGDGLLLVIVAALPGGGGVVPPVCARIGPLTMVQRNANITPNVSNRRFMLISSSPWKCGAIKITRTRVFLLAYDISRPDVVIPKQCVAITPRFYRSG